ncbi:MAG TPA: caspase family protein [Prolixibacteraceae bacterium]|nr:caspase family protein [Prolixibacteraceae bacterium]
MHYLFTTITTLLLTFQILSASEKRALIVAVGSYHEDSGWSKLSALNDADLMFALLEKQGFKPKNIAILQDDKATKNGILKALDNLIAQTEENDIALFHFSGHGQQISDLNGDELDGYDEAIIPYDAYLLPSVYYQGENHIIDDELNTYLHKLREKTGSNGDVIFILDACHSGTATRNTNNVEGYRGTPLRFEFEKNSIQTQKIEQQGYDEQTTNSPSLSPFVVLSASGQNQLNKEIIDEQGNAYGSLSFALSRTLSTANQKISYQTLFDNVRNEMCIAFRGNHFQTPQIEGNTKRLIFAGLQITIPPYYSVLEQVNSKKIIINGGSLSGLTEGSLIDFYTADTSQPKIQTPIAKGIISLVGISKSEVKFDTAVENISGTWGFVKQLNNLENYESVSEMRANVLRKAKSSAPNVQVEIELIPLNSNKERTSKTFKTGEQFRIKAINKGNQNAFFQIIGIQPDNEVLLITDLSILSPNDFMIDAGDTILIDAFTLTACNPAGLEMYKVVASKEQLDLSPIKTMQYSQKRYAGLTEFEHLLNDLFVHDRSAKTFRFENDINIFNYTFTVLEK